MQSLPSAGTRQSMQSLPSAGTRQRACILCHLLADGKEPLAFAICWLMAKYAVSLLTGLTPLRGFAICQLMAKPKALCHQPADGKEAFADRVSNKLFAICWLMAKPLPYPPTMPLPSAMADGKVPDSSSG